MEARAIAAGPDCLCGPGKRRHRAGRTSAQRRYRRSGRACRFRRARADRDDGGRAGRAARGRHRQPVPLARPENLRADERSGAARKFEGFRQGVHETSCDPHRRNTAPSPTPPPRTRIWTPRAHRSFVKADGLAAGKGVVVAQSPDEAHAAVDAMLSGNPGARVVIEEFLEGEEASFIVMVDGMHVLPLRRARTTKRSAGRRSGPEHRRHGGVLARAGRHAATACARDARHHPGRPCAAWKWKASASRVSCTPG